MKILVTGGAGFIGTNFVKYWLRTHPEDQIVVLDKFTYAGNRENLVGLPIEIIEGDICSRNLVVEVMEDIDQVFHFAAESHVDRSIKDAEGFVRTNVYGTYVLLEEAKEWGIKKFIHISTDEVYGSTNGDSFRETDILNPSSPYSSTKASSDLLALSYYKTYGLPVIVTRSSNNYGPYQHTEKMIPTMILSALHEEPLPVYGDGKNVRDWLYVDDNCAAIDCVAGKGKVGEIYNISSHERYDNNSVVFRILKGLDKSASLITYVKDRAGHDRRYAINADKTMRLGWKPKVRFEEGLKKTIAWYQENL